MAKTYNTPTSGKVVDHNAQREFLDALSACVMLTPAEEEKIMPSRIPTPGVDDVDCQEPDDEFFEDDFDDDDDFDDAALVASLLNS